MATEVFIIEQTARQKEAFAVIRFKASFITYSLDKNRKITIYSDIESVWCSTELFVVQFFL